MRRVRIGILVLLFCAGAQIPAAAQPQEETPVCGIENCHGIDILCGPNVPQVCTEIYQIGDFCRAYARCEIIDGLCRQQADPIFENCASCVRACLEEHQEDPMGAFGCEAKCLKQIGQERPEKGERGKYRGKRSKGFGR